MIKYHLMQDQKRKLKIDCINLNNDDIKRRMCISYQRKIKNYQIFKFDFDDLFPADSTEPVVYITNKYYSHHTNKFNLKEKICNNNTKYIYLSIYKSSINEKLSVYYSYTQDGKVYKIKCDLYLEIKCYGTTVYISQYQFKNFRKVCREFKLESGCSLDTFTNSKKYI